MLYTYTMLSIITTLIRDVKLDKNDWFIANVYYLVRSEIL